MPLGFIFSNTHTHIYISIFSSLLQPPLSLSLFPHFHFLFSSHHSLPQVAASHHCRSHAANHYADLTLPATMPFCWSHAASHHADLLISRRQPPHGLMPLPSLSLSLMPTAPHEIWNFFFLLFSDGLVCLRAGGAPRGEYGAGHVASTCGAGRFQGYLPIVRGRVRHPWSGPDPPRWHPY